MLAIQRPSMGSSKPPDLDMPFGYAFDGSSTFPFPSPTAPAPGPSLLDDNESRFLDNFFDGVSSNLDFDFLAHAVDGSELGLGWDEVPPAFMGTTTSFGQHPLRQPLQFSTLGLPNTGYNHLSGRMNNAPTVPSSTSADLMAAATLMQTAPNGRSHSLNNEALFGGQGQGRDLSVAQTNGQIRTHSISHFPQTHTNNAPHNPPARDHFVGDNFYTDMVFGPSVEESMRPRQLSEIHSKADIKWGSDTAFGTPVGFVPPETQRKEEANMDYPFKIMEIGFVESPTSTRPPSPTHPKVASPKKPRFSMNINYDDDTDLKLRKRRKSKHQDDEDEEGSPVSGTTKSKGKKRKSNTKADDDAADQNHKRRKSSAAAAIKATRENLTDDQKRENHIKSEQKRRTLIREGFEDLGELVPGLRGGGFSKSAVLIMSADWLEDLITGNEALRQRLAQMHGR